MLVGVDGALPASARCVLGRGFDAATTKASVATTARRLSGWKAAGSRPCPSRSSSCWRSCRTRRSCSRACRQTGAWYHSVLPRGFTLEHYGGGADERPGASRASRNSIVYASLATLLAVGRRPGGGDRDRPQHRARPGRDRRPGDAAAGGAGDRAGVRVPGDQHLAEGEVRRRRRQHAGGCVPGRAGIPGGAAGDRLRRAAAAVRRAIGRRRPAADAARSGAGRGQPRRLAASRSSAASPSP